MNGWSDKEVIERMVLPRIEGIEEKISDMERELLEGTPWGQKSVAEVRKEVADLRVELVALRTSLLTSDGVEKMFYTLFQKSKSRGWTAREQWMKVGTFVCAILAVVLTILSLLYGHG